MMVFPWLKNTDRHLKKIVHALDILIVLSMRDITARYRHTAIGIAWVVLQPALSVLIMSLVFGRFIQNNMYGLPCPVFICIGFLPWMMVSEGITRSAHSIVVSPDLIKKVFFPRILLPLAVIVSTIVDFFVVFAVLIVLAGLYGALNLQLLIMFPVVLVFCCLIVVGCGTAICALNVLYRDIRNILPFFMQMWLLLTPVVYSSTMLPEPYTRLFLLNPLTGIIEWYRAGVSGVAPIDAIPIAWLLGVAFVVGVAGVWVFLRLERVLADMI